ncbi:hypothetical protein H6761_00920 [Candidatus Nomurabacteria bacterium]|nr:hypothetical protein [Candidatus Nomurabacteria bacterium]
MNLFKDTTWKWWELKIVAWGALMLGLALGTYFNAWLTDWLTLVWVLFIVSWLYVIVAWSKK